MNKILKNIKPTKIAASVFLGSLLIFVISLLPSAYITGSYLAGAAGANSEPIDTIPMSSFERGLSLLSGLVTVVSGIYAIQKTRSELKIKEMDDKMQMREIEKLHLELELEKRRKTKKQANQPAKARQKSK
jgi:hypothetical protein